MQWVCCLSQVSLRWEHVALLGYHGNLGRRQYASVMRKVQSPCCPEGATTTTLITVHFSLCPSLFSVYIHWECWLKAIIGLVFLFFGLFSLCSFGARTKELCAQLASVILLSHDTDPGLSFESSFSISNQELIQTIKDWAWEMVEELTYRSPFQCSLCSDHAWQFL